MNAEEIIRGLKSSNIYAECSCGEEFKLSESILFDGLGKFPLEALNKKKELEEGLKDWAKELKIKLKRATEGAQKTATAVGIGKNLEKVLPTLKNFNLRLSDCRFLADPIDLLILNGITMNKVNSITFMEVKSGKARLNLHQKAIKQAIEDKDVSFRVIK